MKGKWVAGLQGGARRRKDVGKELQDWRGAKKGVEQGLGRVKDGGRSRIGSWRREEQGRGRSKDEREGDRTGARTAEKQGRSDD